MEGQNPHVTWQFKPKTAAKESQIIDPLRDKLDFQNLPKLSRANIRELLLEKISRMIDPDTSDYNEQLENYAKELDEVINE